MVTKLQERPGVVVAPADRQREAQNARLLMLERIADICRDSGLIAPVTIQVQRRVDIVRLSLKLEHRSELEAWADYVGASRPAEVWRDDFITFRAILDDWYGFDLDLYCLEPAPSRASLWTDICTGKPETAQVSA
jgi:hypothetical protein